uniref:Mediator of RNA polymerase II transcription subunit 4 n=1 Tax=Globodera rostochiensis TaxID=31243 RepID=A0A914ID23_GLORO
MEVSLKEQLSDIVNELESVTKQILQNLFADVKRDVQEKSPDEQLKALIDSFNDKQSKLVILLKNVPAHQQRQRHIRSLQEGVQRRDGIIGRLADQIKSIEGSVIEATYQAEKKLKSVKQSEMNRVFSEDVIRFAHQISKNHSVASSVYWQQGDPSRPYPTEANFALSNLLLSRTQPNVPLTFASQTASGGMLNPRLAMFGANMGASTSSASPRGRPSGTGARMASPSTRPKILQRSSSQQSPRFSQLGGLPGQQQPSLIQPSPNSLSMVQPPQSSSNFVSPGGQMMVNLPTNLKPPAPDVQKVEQMSSESSSSSSSGDEASPSGH